MQDKEFDKLFKQRFESFELEPAESVWASIDRELDSDGGRTKRSYGVFWMAAASMIVILSAAIWFAPKEEKVWLQKEEPATIAMKQNEVPADDSNGRKTANEEVAVIQAPKLANIRKGPVKRARVVNEETAITTAEPLLTDPIRDEAFDKVEPGREVIVSDEVLASTEVVLAESSTKDILTTTSSNAADAVFTKDSNVKSIGDLVNFVVGKVDKRRDKLIQFKDNDEGSFITGLNLGFVKIKSRN